ncbi:hypothetical protein N665_2139s0006 [Sinapis alba]|nr:hypothetical protein N665_2139s0006 [Sinapis alba]
MDSSSSKNPQKSRADKEDEVQYVDYQTTDRHGKRKEADTPYGESSQQRRCQKLLCQGLVCGSITPEQRRVMTSAFFTTAKILLVSDEIKNFQSPEAPANLQRPIFREATNDLLVLAELPLSFIESTCWKHFCNKVKLYKPHSRRTATRDIVEMFVKKKEALKRLLYTNQQRVSFTTDI